MITALDDTSPDSRVAYLIPSQALEATLGTPIVDQCEGRKIRFNKARVLNFVKAATERPEVASELCQYLLDLHLPGADPGERVWIYHALGEIAGETAAAGLALALNTETS